MGGAEYNYKAVQSAIDSSGRHGKKISKKEGKLIHALLRGRKISDAPIVKAKPKKKARGGMPRNRHF